MHKSKAFQQFNFDVERTLFIWTIDKVKFSDTPGLIYRSPSFLNEYTATKWHIRLYPNGVTYRSASDTMPLSLILDNWPERASVVYATYRFTIQNSSESFVCETNSGTDEFTMSKNWGHRFFLMRNKLKDSCLDGVLKIQVELTVYVEELSIATTKSQSSERLVSEFCYMLENKKFCDLVLTVGGTDIEVHCLVLAGSSPVFSAMLDQEPLENGIRRIEIIDFSVETVQKLVNFIYKRELPSFADSKTEMVLELMKASDVYAVDELKNLLMDHLVSNLSTRNVAKILLVADEGHFTILKDKCLKYLCANADRLSQFDEENDLKERSDLLKEILLKLSKCLSSTFITSDSC